MNPKSVPVLDKIPFLHLAKRLLKKSSHTAWEGYGDLSGKTIYYSNGEPAYVIPDTPYGVIQKASIGESANSMKTHNTGGNGMSPKNKSILSKSPFSRVAHPKNYTDGMVNVGPHDRLVKVPSWEEMARSRGQTVAYGTGDSIRKGDIKMSDKCPRWEDMVAPKGVRYGLDGKAYGVGDSIQEEARRMEDALTIKHFSNPAAVVESASSAIKIRLEILKILFSSPHFGPDRGFTTKAVENWVKTGEGEGLAFVEWSK